MVAAAEAAELNVLVNTGLLAPDDRAATEARADCGRGARRAALSSARGSPARGGVSK